METVHKAAAVQRAIDLAEDGLDSYQPSAVGRQLAAAGSGPMEKLIADG
jgi:hypothetical protein